MDATRTRKDTLYRKLRSVIRTTRKTVRSLPSRLRNARTAFVFNSSPQVLTIGEFGPFRVAYRQGTADEGVLNESFNQDLFFSGVPEYEPRPHDTIIDVGAHIGTFALLAASKVPEGNVYAIEACRESYQYAALNAGLNNLSNLEVCHLAMADFCGTTRLSYNTNSGTWGHTITKRFSRHGEDVRTETLAGFMQARKIEWCDFLKFNCEGAEFPIILGSSKATLERVGLMLVLYHRDLAAGYHHHELREHLSSCGFATDVRKEGHNRGWIVARNLRAAAAPRQYAKSA